MKATTMDRWFDVETEQPSKLGQTKSMTNFKDFLKTKQVKECQTTQSLPPCSWVISQAATRAVPNFVTEDDGSYGTSQPHFDFAQYYASSCANIGLKKQTVSPAGYTYPQGRLHEPRDKNRELHPPTSQMEMSPTDPSPLDLPGSGS